MSLSNLNFLIFSEISSYLSKESQSTLFKPVGKLAVRMWVRSSKNTRMSIDILEIQLQLQRRRVFKILLLKKCEATIAIDNKS